MLRCLEERNHKETEEMKTIKNPKSLGTDEPITWCPGCPNFMILAAFKQTLQRMISVGKMKQTDFAITTDIGCHAKMFDYLNLSGIYCLHGRALPTATGITLGNPNKKVVTFAGDGAVYSEGMGHLIPAFRYNSDMTLILHDNQSFSLTTGQPTPTSQKGYQSKAKPQGEENNPLNPLMIALGAGATFIARTNARDIPHMVAVFGKAMKHKGFSFVEVIQDCLIFNLDINNKDKLMYNVKDNSDFDIACKLAREFDYNSKAGKIPIGVLYQKKADALSDKWGQLKKLTDDNTIWVN